MVYTFLTLAFSFLALAKPLVVLDPGHEPSRPGSIGVCGKEEMAYNDEVVALLARALEKKGVDIALTREAGQELVTPEGEDKYLPEAEKKSWAQDPRLYDRAAIANRLGAAAFLSIHHDSTSADYQETNPGACNGKDGKRLNAAFRKSGYHPGFSIFVYKGEGEDARFQKSLKLARAIGKGMVEELKRKPSNHHADPKDCASCVLLDKKYGVWQKNLAVLRASAVPAALVEVGVIVDIADEKAVSGEPFRAKLALVLRDALRSVLPAR